MPSSDGDGNIGSPVFRRLPVLCGVLGVSMILGNGVLGDDVAVLTGEVYIVEPKLEEEYMGIFRSVSSLLILLLQDDVGSFLGNAMPSSSLSSSSWSSENSNDGPPP